MASSFEIELRGRAKRHLQAMLDLEGDAAYMAALRDIQRLGEDPFPEDATKLRRNVKRYRIYTYRSRYRIVYTVTKDRVIIERVLPRPFAYSGLEKWGRDRTNPDQQSFTRRVRLVRAAVR